MTDYTLYYWPIPFRGQFVRAVLCHVGAEWEEAGAERTAEILRADPADQPVPHMGPPVLTDHRAGVSLSEMPAIMSYLGHIHGLMPGDAVRDALTEKVLADANDVLYETTRHNGAQMWDAETWAGYRPRLARWMALFEELGRRHGLTAREGTLLGTDAPGIADFAALVLWGTMTERLPALRPMLDSAAPGIAGLADRLGALPEQAGLRARSAREYGDSWCGGQIEASLRSVL